MIRINFTFYPPHYDSVVGQLDFPLPVWKKIVTKGGKVGASMSYGHISSLKENWTVTKNKTNVGIKNFCKKMIVLIIILIMLFVRNINSNVRYLLHIYINVCDFLKYF